MEDKNEFVIKDLCFSYDKAVPILRHLNFVIKKGRITTIMGSNGCGKSTLFQLLTKNLYPDMGEIQIQGINIDSVSIKQFAKKVAIVHQYNTTPDDLTVEELVSYGRTPYKKVYNTEKENEANKKKVEQSMKITGVYKYKDRSVSSLSGGQKQRVWISMALAQGTKILFLDEPTTYLDIKYQLQILKLVRALNRKFNITIIMVLHDINQSLFYSDDIIAISKQGTILAQGPPEKVIIPEIINKMYGVDLEMVKIEGKPMILPV